MKVLLPVCMTATGLTAGLPACAIAGDDGASAEWLFETRTRYQTTEKYGYEDADALTHRTALGVKLPLADSGFSLLAEVENNIAIAGTHNTSTDPEPGYATINDPDHTELNRLSLSYKPNDSMSFTLGRQYVAFDDFRFVSSAGWRQDRNSHDAAVFSLKQDDLKVTYAYHWQFNRLAGTDFDWDTDAHLLNASYEVSDHFKLGGFAYLIDINEAGFENRSNLTYGGTIKASHKLNDDTKVYFDLMAARQSDYGSSMLDFDLGFLAMKFALKTGGFKATLGYDYIEGDGSTSIQAPFTAPKKFGGWATVFFNGGGQMAPADGLEDLYISGGYGQKFEGDSFIEGVNFSVTYHDYEAENTGADLGSEWDASVKFDLPNNLNFEVGYADYDNGGNYGAPKDTTKAWASLSFKY